MIPLIQRLCILAFVLLFSGHSLAANTVTNIVTESPLIQSQFQYIKDTSGHSNVGDIINRPDGEWQLIESGSSNFGVTTSPYWLRFSLKNITSKHINLITTLDYPQLDDVVFYVYSGNKKVHEFATGDARPFYPREVDHPNMLLRVNLIPEEIKTIYIRIQTEGSMILPLQIWHENLYFSAASKEQKLHFFYYGCLTIIMLINLAVFLFLREKLYLYYSLAIAGYLLFFMSILGYSFQHFYPLNPNIHSRALLLSMPILAFFSVLFCREFLKTKSHSPTLDLGLRAMMYFEIFNFFSALLFSYNLAILISAISAFFFFFILLAAGPITWMAGLRAGAFFTVAWSPLTIGVLATAGRSLGIFPENFLTQYGMQIGSGLEAFILTLALADRLYHEREEKIQAQTDSFQKEKARHDAQSQLVEAMSHDPITHLPNLNRFERMVNQQLQRDPKSHYIVGVARVTRLVEINRTLGLTRSERLLNRIAKQMVELAERLPGIQSQRDKNGHEERVYQLSGDCFGMLIRADEVNDRFESIDKAFLLLAKPMLMDGLAIELHPQFGAASYPAHGDNAALLIRNAHVGMEMTPQGQFLSGYYSPDYDIYSESRLTLMSDLREALNKNQTQLYYQPKACMTSGEIVSLEALIRWHHPERGWVYPNDFIPLAEETGVITHITRWALEQGIADLAILLHDHPNLSVSINISARDLETNGLSDLIETTLNHYHVKADRLTIELTETAIMENPEIGLTVLERLADVGLRVSIDDFGSGYSSLSYLKQLPATEIKLDRSLVMDICSCESSKIIVETSINMAHGLGYKVVAEGVEDKETARLLQALNCDWLQGYWLCYPLPIEKLKPWLNGQPKLFED
ncbi:EAL domain-containing protein [Alkalimarinus alittae]|uniref:EAL domain-containing protein n=1 Tax=Alkalimarinus alittae TaxID=2961619 RepID=A0ABY6MZT2_9ALTE|nr:EAL domain-containing protein [Alkalimarinus alittae]UZE95282.1 EAL domain-containing protein [Alkalimarinus alittae]